VRRHRDDNSLRQHGQLVPPEPDDQLVAACIGPDGIAAALWASPAAARALNGLQTNSAGVASAHTMLAQPVTARVTLQRSSGHPDTIVITDLRLAHPDIALLPGGDLLIVGARCAWTPDHVEPNAAIYSGDGTLTRRGIVGDGIAHVRTTPSGAIWIGYSDEGIFGNFGWGVPGPAPVGHRGLMRFDSNLEPGWISPRPTTRYRRRRRSRGDQRRRRDRLGLLLHRLPDRSHRQRRRHDLAHQWNDREPHACRRRPRRTDR